MTMEKQEIKAFFENNEHHINERFVALMMKEMPDHEGFGDQTESKYRAGSRFLTPVIQTALVTGTPAILDYQMEWAKDRLPQDNHPLPKLKQALTLYKQIIDELFPEKLVEPAHALIDRMLAQLPVS